MCSSCSSLTLHRINNLLHCWFSTSPTYINHPLILILKPCFSTPFGSCCSLPVNDLRYSIPVMPCLWWQSVAPSPHHVFFPRNKKGLSLLIGPCGQQLRHDKVLFCESAVLCMCGVPEFSPVSCAVLSQHVVEVPRICLGFTMYSHKVTPSQRIISGQGHHQALREVQEEAKLVVL